MIGLMLLKRFLRALAESEGLIPAARMRTIAEEGLRVGVGRVVRFRANTWELEVAVE